MVVYVLNKSLHMMNVLSILAVLSVATIDFDISAAPYYTCAAYGDTKCWGRNHKGQLGQGHTDTLSSISSVDLGADFAPKELDCAYDHCCALSTASTTKCWGGNSFLQLGLGDSDNRGDTPGRMGDNLTVVDWGSEFVVDQIRAAYGITCVLSFNHEIKCVGKNDYGQLGKGNVIGTMTGETGDAVPFIDLGSGFEPIWIEDTGAGLCALSNANDLKCFGYNADGELGLGDTDNRGDDPDEMGDHLVSIDFGSNFVISSFHCGAWTGSHCCVISTANGMKCWGNNDCGQLGYGDTNNRGDNVNEMGDFLGFVDIGTGFIVADLSLGQQHTCVLSTTGATKCFGYGYYGQLGRGNTYNRGNELGQMGDVLFQIDFGTGFSAVGVATGFYDTCVYDDSLSVKCIGYNYYGELGYGDTNNRGDQSNELGDNLPVVELGYTKGPTSNPTSIPTADPTFEPTDITADPTSNPTDDPTANPTDDPTSNPTDDPTSNPTDDPTVEPTMEPSDYPSAPFAAPTSDECGATDCSQCEDMLDEQNLQLKIQYAVNAVLALAVMVLVCKDVCCCKKDGNMESALADSPDEDKNMLPVVVGPKPKVIVLG